MPPLPPLPPLSVWKSKWPRTVLRYSLDRSNREFQGRVLLVNPKIANDFVKALKLRKNEVVVEAFPGPGALTRALINGGVAPDSNAEVGTTATTANKPAVVVACEPSPQMLIEGLGMSKDDQPGDIPASFDGDDMPLHQARVYQSSIEPRLLLSPSTPYRWPTLSQILSNPLVKPHMPTYDGNSQKGEISVENVEKGHRPWNAPKPAITIVSQMPHSVAGDQMVAQWIGSAVGNGNSERTWIWQWGRVRLALLVGKNQYDRMMAGPGETIHCKLSVMTRALFNVSALPPYHHVFNVDKSSNRIADTPIGKRVSKSKGTKKVPTSIEPPPQAHPYTTTYPDDFYPIAIGSAKHLDVPFPRPESLGILLEPKLDSPINQDNKDEWDYVLRKCFVTEAQPIQSALKNLAFGAEGLMGKIEGTVEGNFKGKNVLSTKVVRDMEIDEWARVVDVFRKWAFKPDNLILDSRPDDEAVRQIGQD